MNPKNDFDPKKSSKKEIICYLLRQFYSLGWCTGSGGGISIRECDSKIWIAPSGVHKEFVKEDDLFQIDLNGNVLCPQYHPNLRCSECTPLFFKHIIFECWSSIAFSFFECSFNNKSFWK